MKQHGHLVWCQTAATTYLFTSGGSLVDFCFAAIAMVMVLLRQQEQLCMDE